MFLDKKIKLWKICLLHLIQNIKNISLGSTFKNFEYTKFIENINKLNTKINTASENLLLCETVHYYIIYNIHILLNDSVIHYIKNQKSFSYSNNIDQLYSNINKYAVISNLIYAEIKKYIIDNKILNEDCTTNCNKILNNSIISILFFINDMSNKNIKINIKKIYKILNIHEKKIDNNNINNIQLIIYPIKSIISKEVTNYHEEINNLTIRFPNSSFYTIYNIYPLINKQNNIVNIFTALNADIINRLQTIENIPYTSKEKTNDFNKDYNCDTLNIKVGDNSFISPSFFKDDNSNYHFYPFGGINLYTKKYLIITENIILTKMKHDNTINIKKYFENDNKQKKINPILYNIGLLLSIMLKEFKKQYDYYSSNNNVNMLEYINIFLLVVGKEYSHNGYIANALKKIHNIECKRFILNAQIINPHINLKKFEKELRIRQIITINNNVSELWLSIKNEFSKKKIEHILKGAKLEQEKNILQHMKIIFSSVLEQKNKLECIPNSLKLFGIIHHNVNRL